MKHLLLIIHDLHTFFISQRKSTCHKSLILVQITWVDRIDVAKVLDVQWM
jgi:hypothetical protein